MEKCGGIGNSENSNDEGDLRTKNDGNLGKKEIKISAATKDRVEAAKSYIERTSFRLSFFHPTLPHYNYAIDL